MTATTSNKRKLCAPSSSSYHDDLFSQFAYQGNAYSIFRFPPTKCTSKSNEQKSTGGDFGQKRRVLLEHETPILTLEDLQELPPSQAKHQAGERKPLGHDIPILTIEDLQDVPPDRQSSKPKHEIPILTLEDLQEGSPNIQTSEAKHRAAERVLAHEPPILTLEDLRNAEADQQPAENPPAARRILRFYRKFGIDQQMLQKTSPFVRHSEAVQQGVRKVSRYFQNVEAGQKAQRKTSPYFQNSNSTQQGERIVSRYFQNSAKKRAAHNKDEDEDANVTEQSNKRLMVGDYSEKRRNDVGPSSRNSEANQHSMGKASRSFQKSGADQRVRIVSRFFQNSEKNYEAKRKVSPSFQSSKSNQQGERVVSPFFQKSAKQQAVNNQQEGAEVLEQPNECAKSVKKIHKPAKERKHRSKRSSARPRTTLSAAEWFLEAYRRKSSDDKWDPPPSEVRLLQQDHAYDPWRVLLICMLLNRTTGQQAKDVIPKLFTLCPNAKAALEVSREQIEDIIRPLGLQRKRSRTIQLLSEMYLKGCWSHVTQLPGVGKYGADAHAIFCTGYWDQIIPKDHKLNYYWEFLHSIKDQL